MKLNYKITNNPVITTSQLKRTELQDAMFYVFKEDGIVSYELELKNTYIDLGSAIYSVENLKTKCNVKANTTDILLTDICVDETPYFYELKTYPETSLKIEEVHLHVDKYAIELNGRVFTNTYINNYEISDGTYIFSTPTINNSIFNVTYYNDYILTSIAKKRDQYIYAKSRSDTSLTLSKINDNTVQLSSFYIKNRSGISQFIEGDVLLLNKKEATKIENNYITLKDKALSVNMEGYLNTVENVLYLPESYISEQDVIVEYKAKRSSHILEIDVVKYLKFVNNSIVSCSSLDCDLIIRKKVDTSKVKIIPNDFLSSPHFRLATETFGLSFNKVLDETSSKMLTNYLYKENYRNASEQVYIEMNNLRIYQETLDETPIEIKTKDSLYDYLEVDYQEPLVTIIHEDKDRVIINNLKKSYF